MTELRHVVFPSPLSNAASAEPGSRGASGLQDASASAVLAALVLCAATLSGCARARASAPVVELRGPTMGAGWKVTIASATISDTEQARLQRVIQGTAGHLETLLSTWQATSELSRFNASRSTERFPVQPETFEAFRWGAQLSIETNGAMDPTVAPLLDAWGFGVRRDVPPPNDATVARLRADVGMNLVELDPQGGWIRKRRPGVQCTFSAFVPGYAADRIGSVLLNRGYSNFLIDVGGELVAHGHNADGRPWRVAIERPQIDGRAVERVIAIDNRAISTSGDYRNFHKVGANRLPHILDPRLGRPVQHALASASVLAAEGVRADGLSTALMVLGPDKAMDFARAHGLDVLLVVRTADGEFEERMTPGFPVAR